MRINIDNFKKYSFEILTVLSEEFPKAQEIDFDEIYEAQEYEQEEYDEKVALHLGAISFLMQEEYIYNAPKGSSSFSLTSKGLALFDMDVKSSLEHLVK